MTVIQLGSGKGEGGGGEWEQQRHKARATYKDSTSRASEAITTEIRHRLHQQSTHTVLSVCPETQATQKQFQLNSSWFKA